MHSSWPRVRANPRVASIAALVFVAALANGCAQPTETIATDSERALIAPALDATPTALPAPAPTELPVGDRADAVSADAPVDETLVPDPDDVEAAAGDPANVAVPTTVVIEALHPLIAVLPDESRFETLFGRGTWELDTSTLLVPGATGQTTCEQVDPPYLDGFNTKFQSLDHHQYVLVQIQTGDGAEAWRELIERFPNCAFGVVATEISVDGADQSVVLASDGPSPDGYWSVAAANLDEHFLLLIGGAYAPDGATLDAESLAMLASEILIDIEDA